MSAIRATRTPASVILVISAFALLAMASSAAAGPPAGENEPSWAGTYSGASGMTLTLKRDSAGEYSGELVIESQYGASTYPVTLSESAGGKLNGQFDSGGASFSLVVESGSQPGTIVLNSEGNIHELERTTTATANPLAADSGGTTSSSMANSKPFRHPEGRFWLDAPVSWEPILHSPDILQFRTQRDEDIVMVLDARLEPHELGKPLLEVLPGAMQLVDEFLAEVGIGSDSSTARSVETTVGPLPAAVSRWKGQTIDRRFAILQGTVVKGDRAVLVFGTVDEGNKALLERVEEMFATIRIPSSEEAAAIAATNFASGRNVVFNGERITDATLRWLEGDAAAGTIPDGLYWYDRMTGMAGEFGGPTLAFLAADLDFCPALSPAASGSGTQVAINGRYLHPQDLAGLEFYFGPIQPNRYWMDSMGNYGLENGPSLGNLIEQIAAIQAMAAAAAQQGQGSYDSTYEGGYNEALYGGGSVYRHFPNLGSSGTSVTVADAGGGDTIVSAGGVMWWPGK